MPFCEVCGSECKYTNKRKIEGAVLNVGPCCKNMGTPVYTQRQKRELVAKKQTRSSGSTTSQPIHYQKKQRPSAPRKPRQPRKNIANMKLVDDYIKKLVDVRNKNGLSKDEFADALKIQRSYYHRIEKGTTALPITLAETIGKKFNVKLTEMDEVVEEHEYEQLLKESKKKSTGSMVYFRKRGEKPDYE